MAGGQRRDPEDVHHRLEEEERDPGVASGKLSQCPEGAAVLRRVRAGLPPVVVAAEEGDGDAREQEDEVTDEVFVVFRTNAIPHPRTEKLQHIRLE